MYCTKCGKEIADNAVICPQCGMVPDGKQMQNNPPKKRHGCLIAVCIVAGVMAFFATMIIVFSDSSEPHNSPYNEFFSGESQTEEPIVDVSVAELLNAYDQNELRANNTYKGAMIRVTGYISNISASGTSYATVYINAGDDYILSQKVYCTLYDDNSLSKLSRMSQGDKITVVGRCKGENSWSLTSDIELTGATME